MNLPSRVDARHDGFVKSFRPWIRISLASLAGRAAGLVFLAVRVGQLQNDVDAEAHEYWDAAEAAMVPALIVFTLTAIFSWREVRRLQALGITILGVVVGLLILEAMLWNSIFLGVILGPLAGIATVIATARLTTRHIPTRQRELYKPELPLAATFPVATAVDALNPHSGRT